MGAFTRRGATARRMTAVVVAAAFAAALGLSGCSSPAEQAASAPQPATATHAASPTTSASPAPSRQVTPLPTGVRADYQLGGGYTPPAGVKIVTRDSTDAPAAGLYNICYVNGFQTQGEDKQFWLTKHPTLVVRGSNGKPVSDPGWPDEMILDSSTAAKRGAITTILTKTLTTCSTKGFQATEFDNLDSYTRSHGALTQADNVALATLLVAAAHKLGLAAGQKNTSQIGMAGKTVIGFDFAVAEQCYRYNECATYTKVYGASVIDIEYTDDLRGTFAAACADPRTPAMTILRDIDLTTPKNKHYAYRACDPSR